MKNKTRNQNKKSAARVAKTQDAASTEVDSAVVFREGFESMVVAILLALLFRGFEAEAFIIPTGSMAPTLQGRHKDLRCPECDFRYRSNQPATSRVNSTTCPMCRYELQARSGANDPLEVTYNGDRIIVNKFAYQIGDPKRWDVIVFKFPGNAKQNYIKRLVGLPEETLQISGGDVFAKGPDEDEFSILRKPVKKIPYMLHLVHDTRYIPQTLIDADWPARWHTPESSAGQSNWEVSADRREYVLKPHDEVGWLRYRHLPLQPEEWERIEQPSRNRRGSPESNSLPVAPRVPGRLITDWYAYNAYNQGMETGNGLHWVGDLAMEATVDVASDSGELWLDLVEGGDNYRCQIDVSNGVAQVELPDGTNLTANTSVRGKGSHRIRWANLDDQVLLWVDDEPVEWQANGVFHPGHYAGERLVKPKWSAGDLGDLMPAGMGGRNIGLKVTKLKIFRDIYYTTVKQTPRDPTETTDYVHTAREIARRTLIDPPADSSEADALFSDRRKSVEFQLGENQYFPMGDNSPASKDARLWAINHSQVTDSKLKYIDNYVERDLLIGKAILVYWPHGWPLGPISGAINPVPNVDRMGKIR